MDTGLEEATLLGSPLVELKLETCKQRTIPNRIGPDPIVGKLEYWRDQEGRRHSWKRRRRPCGGYNCFGMVWASRRTEIVGDGGFDGTEQVIEMILEDDGYRPVAEPMRGDIARYVNATHGTIHVGLVVDVLANGTVRILSKFDGTSGEYEHDASDAALSFSFTISYWTDRPL